MGVQSRHQLLAVLIAPHGLAHPTAVPANDLNLEIMPCQIGLAYTIMGQIDDT